MFLGLTAVMKDRTRLVFSPVYTLFNLIKLLGNNIKTDLSSSPMPGIKFTVLFILSELSTIEQYPQVPQINHFNTLLKGGKLSLP